MTDSWDPGTLRIGDAERDTAATALGDHFAAGRLYSAEYDERVAAVWSARTRADLPVLFDDLPGGPPESLRLVTPAPGPTQHWVASPSAWQQGRRAVTTRASQLPVWLLVLAGVVLVPVAFVVISSALPLIVAGLIAWFFLAGPGRCGRGGHHRWNRAARR